jgi:hypothetical protein
MTDDVISTQNTRSAKSALLFFIAFCKSDMPILVLFVQKEEDRLLQME